MAFAAIPALSFGEDPRDTLRDLGSDSFQERSSAEERLGAWAEGNGKVAKDWLAASMEATEDPEVKQRLRKVLKDLVVGEAIATGPGYVGIQMAPAQVMVPGEDRLSGCSAPFEVGQLEVLIRLLIGIGLGGIGLEFCSEEIGGVGWCCSARSRPGA